MNVQVVEGKFVEGPTTDARGTDRRAFGEFIVSHAIDEDHSLLDVLDLEPGHSAVREHPGAPWRRRLDHPR